MKTRNFIFIISLLSSTVFAQSGQIKLRGTRLTYPVVRKWVSEFNKIYPDISVEVGSKVSADSIDLEILAFNFDRAKLGTTKETIVLNRYAQLPIANANRPGLAALQAKGFTEADFKRIYFSTEPGQVAAGSAPIVIYKREKPACAAVSFASHYGSDANKTPGVGVQGDDSNLSIAVKRDPNGLSYNNLGFIYNVNTRKVNDSLAIVPLDLNENGKIDADEQVYTTLDDVLEFIEKSNHPRIPTDEVHVLFKKEIKNQSAVLFLNWILNEGQKYNHEFGFLNQPGTNLQHQKEVLASTGNIKKSESSCEGANKLQRKPSRNAQP